MSEDEVQYIVELLTKRRMGTLTVAEEIALQQWADNNADLFDELTNDDRLKDAIQEGHRSQQKVLSILKSHIPELDPSYQAPALPTIKRVYYRYYWAAAILVALATTSILYYIHDRRLQAQTIVSADLAPGSNRAILHLADGSTIALDSAHQGAIAQQGKNRIDKQDSGHIIYVPLASMAAAPVSPTFNTITTPRGGQYQVTLSDGSKVWLNAASSLHFPTAFGGNQRRVQLTGEAYFEIAQNKGAPFIVEVNHTQVQVLGTHFDVMAYPEDSILTTTLLEGGIRVTNGSISKTLAPGQRALIPSEGNLKVVTDPDADRFIAWKNGDFAFHHDGVHTVMNQLARWYNVDIVYEGNPPITFTGEISRSNNASDVLQALEALGNVHFQIKDRTIVILK